MLSYCLKPKNKTNNIDLRIENIKNRTIMISLCVVCGSKKSRFIKEKRASGLLSSLGIKMFLSQVLSYFVSYFILKVWNE